MSTIADQIRAAASAVTEYPTGKKLPSEPRSMVIIGQCLGPATTEANHSVPVGSIEPCEVIEGVDDPNREPPNAWVDMPD